MALASGQPRFAGTKKDAAKSPALGVTVQVRPLFSSIL